MNLVYLIGLTCDPTNIYKIAYNAINNKGRPNYLYRSKNSSTGLDEPVKPKFTRFEISKPC